MSIAVHLLMKYSREVREASCRLRMQRSVIAIVGVALVLLPAVLDPCVINKTSVVSVVVFHLYSTFFFKDLELMFGKQGICT